MITKRALLVVAAPIAAAALGYFAILLPVSQWLRGHDIEEAMAQLPSRLIAPMILAEETTPDLVVFQDGDDGWFELDVSALSPELEIGFYGPRLFDAMIGNDHLPLYCGGERAQAGKIIWAVSDRQIARDYAFCNPGRMDLAALRPLAAPVEMITSDFNRAELDAVGAEISSDPDRAWVSWPQSFSPQTHRRILSLPMLWFAPDSDRSRLDVQFRVEEALLEALDQDGTVTFNRRPNTQMVVSIDQTDQGPVSGMAVRQGDDLVVLNGFWAEAPLVSVDCMPDRCGRLDQVDLAPLIAPGRDMVALENGLRDGAVSEVEIGPASNVPSLEALRQDRISWTSATPITYQIRYIQRP
ncbi:hypothetical protein V8J82_15420 [Gymnodinialimonas sp. 2305UL16-5]|uniref:hypothetical protein n=1 Tax=Gymnodinialimonas mytili TaxID=3126503 RepID=UPI0030972858